jgi:hypothetical protein
MNQAKRIMWNGTVRALPLKEQLRAAAIAGCQALSVTPSDYNKWLGASISTHDMLAMADDAGVRITHLNPFVRWVDQWMPDLPAEDFPTHGIAFDVEDFFRMAAALKVQSFTAWGGFPAGRYTTPQLIDAFGALCRRAERGIIKNPITSCGSRLTISEDGNELEIAVPELISRATLIRTARRKSLT